MKFFQIARKFWPCFVAVSVAVIAVTYSPSADAVTLSFFNIAATSVANAAAGETQLSVEVTDSGSGDVLFTFNNVGPLASSIADIYFDDDVPLFTSTVAIDNSDPGVSFGVGASPPGLPGGNSFGFGASSISCSADSDSPVQPNGVNPSETLGLTFTLLGVLTFSDVLTAFTSDTLRIGIHVQGFGDGGSESFISTLTPVPLPAALPLFAGGLGIFGYLGWRRRRVSRATATAS